MSFNDLFNAGEFIGRHIGINADSTQQMLQAVGADSIDAFLSQTVPDSVRIFKPHAERTGGYGAGISSFGNLRGCFLGDFVYNRRES